MVGEFRDDRGSVTAEFVIMLPAVMVVLSLIVGAVLLVSQRLVLTAAANDVARFEARGAADAGAERLSQLPAGVDVERQREGQVLCVTLRAGTGSGLLSVLGIEGVGCAALSDGVFTTSTKAGFTESDFAV